MADFADDVALQSGNGCCRVDRIACAGVENRGGKRKSTERCGLDRLNLIYAKRAVARPINRLIRLGYPRLVGFEDLRLKVRCATLAIPTRHDNLVVRTDASQEAMGIVIYRRDANGYLQPVEHKSKAFVDAQKKLPAHDRECFGLLYALKYF
jgi:hypothetical protein